MKMFKTISLFAALLVLFFSAVSAQHPPQTFTFDRTAHDFGVLKTGQADTAVFTLTNTGGAPLILLDVTVSCNCAKIQWPRQPIPPGENARLIVTYKDRQPGAFYKVVDITTNGTPRRAQLRLKGSIEK